MSKDQIKLLVAVIIIAAAAGSYLHFYKFSAAKELVRAELLDPDSAEFRSVSAYGRKESRIVCGEVKSKNVFGGPGRFNRFIAMESIAVAVIEPYPGAAPMETAWKAHCIN